MFKLTELVYYVERHCQNTYVTNYSLHTAEIRQLRLVQNI